MATKEVTDLSIDDLAESSSILKTFQTEVNPHRRKRTLRSITAVTEEDSY